MFCNDSCRRVIPYRIKFKIENCFYILIYIYFYDRLYLWGVIENGKRFAFRQSEYILRTSSIFGGDTGGR